MFCLCLVDPVAVKSSIFEMTVASNMDILPRVDIHASSILKTSGIMKILSNKYGGTSSITKGQKHLKYHLNIIKLHSVSTSSCCVKFWPIKLFIILSVKRYWRDFLFLLSLESGTCNHDILCQNSLTEISLPFIKLWR